jgi:hypothetical protein
LLVYQRQISFSFLVYSLLRYATHPNLFL